MTQESVLLTSGSSAPPHTLEILGGPESAVKALAAALQATSGYRTGATGDAPAVCLVLDSMDHHPDEVVASYVRAALASTRKPIPLFVTSRRERFRRRGLAWENEFLFSSGTLLLDELAARIRMLVYMWGNAPFPADVIRDAVVGSFRMMMQIDADDYHHRSMLVEDLQRCAEWDGRTPPPDIRLAPRNDWAPPIASDHPYARLFPDAYSQIELDVRALIANKARHHLEESEKRTIRDLANTILRKIPGMSGRVVQSLGGARPHVLIIDDEAAAIVATLKQHRVGYENDSGSLGEIFHFVAEELNLNGNPPCPRTFDAWIRDRVSGEVAPGGSLTDLRCADLILLDLSLNQGQESELAGFIMLEKLRKAIPEIPLVIHTGSAALGHIIQAIRNGADWYVRKDAARAYSDLASIFDDIGRRPEWRKRANRLRRERNFGNEAELDALLARDEYLYIWRCLAADEPQGDLYVQPFTAGASGAVTCGIEVVADARGDRTPERYPLSSFVAKIDSPYVMVSERERFRRLVRPFIGNRAGRIDSEVIYAGAKTAGISYTFSGIHQGQRDERRAEIKPLGTFLSRSLDSRNATFTEVGAPVFQELLYDLLETLHRVSPGEERAAWAEPLFGECRTLRDAHELRLPPLLELELASFGDAERGVATNVDDATAGTVVHLPLCRIQRPRTDDFSVTFHDLATGRTHRAKLTGEIAQFLARFRTLRPNRALSVSGKVIRTRAAYYGAVSEELRDDIAWLEQNGYENPLSSVESVLAVFDDVDERVGIIHGDLNLNNILIDTDTADRPVRGALWLIDFARTRRDSVAHDFAELEVDLVTRLLASSAKLDAGTMMTFLRSLDAGPLYDRQHFDATAAFVSEACQFIRRAAAAARIDKREYLATLVMYYLIVLKLNRKSAALVRGVDPGAQLRRWSVIGAAAALDDLRQHDANVLAPGTAARLPVRRTGPSNELRPSKAWPRRDPRVRT